MEIYLSQHAQAKSSKEDPARPISEEGESITRRVAEYLEKVGIKVDNIYHSGKLRAKQTADILAKSICLTGRAEMKSGLEPSDDVRPIVEWLEQHASEEINSIVIVAHLPFLNKLASLLTSGNENAHIVMFHNSGLVKLVPKPSGRDYSIEWILTPQLV